MSVPSSVSSSDAGPWPDEGAGELADVLPGFEVMDFIGRGGIGAVYQVRQLSLNRVVAVKLLAPHAASDAGGLDFAARFKVEAQAMARLNHPNIVAVHDFGESEDRRLFYVMELVEGTDLGRRIASGGRLPPEEALRVALAMCDALICAHAQGVVHRHRRGHRIHHHFPAFMGNSSMRAFAWNTPRPNEEAGEWTKRCLRFNPANECTTASASPQDRRLLSVRRSLRRC